MLDVQRWTITELVIVPFGCLILKKPCKICWAQTNVHKLTYLLPVSRNLQQAQRLANIDKIEDVFLETGAAEANRSLQKLRAEARVHTYMYGGEQTIPNENDEWGLKELLVKPFGDCLSTFSPNPNLDSTHESPEDPPRNV